MITVPEAFQLLEEIEDDIQSHSEAASPIVTMGKREEAYDEPPLKKQYTKTFTSGKKDPVCGICLSGPERNKKGKKTFVKPWAVWIADNNQQIYQRFNSLPRQ